MRPSPEEGGSAPPSAPARSRVAAAVVALSDGLDRGMRMATMGFIVVLVGLVILQVVARYVFSSPPPWTEEMARYAMIWAGLLGATLSFKRRFDPALFNGARAGSAVARRFNRIGQTLPVLVYLLPILFYCFVGANGRIERSFLVRHSRMTADAFDVTTLLVAVAVPITILTIFVHLAARWCGDEIAPPPAEGREIG